jgi:Nif-specific regulatory protein/two-component system response regulator HydG
LPHTAIPFNTEEIALLYRIAQTLLQEHEYGEILADVLDVTIEGLGADRGFVVVREEGKFRAAVARNFASESLTEAEEEVSDAISEAVVRQERSLLIGDALSAELLRDRSSVHRLGLRSVLCGPLAASNEAFALIYLENRQVSNCFTERHRELLDEICRLAAPRLRTAVAVAHATKRARMLEDGLDASCGIVTADPGLVAVLKTARQVAPTDLPVLIQGETGTGKELVARVLYRCSGRSSGEYVVVNCAAMPGSLIESELFGYVRGAFTGAVRDRIGLIASAHRGTCFLDEVGELPLELQSRLLRILQSGEFTRLGSSRQEVVDVRFIAATNRNLEREVEEGRFRGDLFFRLSGITLKIPPLRDRLQDIHLLADHFLRAYAGRLRRDAPRLSDECLKVLEAYSFPGNVRELESEMARLAAVTPLGTLIGPEALNERFRGPRAPAGSMPVEDCGLPSMSLAEMERRLIQTLLDSTGGNRTRAAEILGISREGLRVKMQRLGISAGDSL